MIYNIHTRRWETKQPPPNPETHLYIQYTQKYATNDGTNIILYTATCSCGWESLETPQRARLSLLHDLHITEKQ